MTISGMEAWVTSAVEEKDVDKALLLAHSIRKVLSSKKLAVMTSFAVSKATRDKLSKTFDLVHTLEPTTPNGLSLEDHAKVEGLSLVIFNKCVYLSPNMMVLKNCDDIFDKYDKFAMGGKGNELDSSVYLFTPGMEHKEALEKILNPGNTPAKIESGSFGSCFSLWIKNNVPNLEKLDDEYNVTLNLRGGSPKSLGSGATMTIANFGDAHPLDLAAGQDFLNLKELGTIEQFAVEQFRNIEMEYSTFKSSVCSDLSLHLGDFKTEPIAIVGMSFRLPGANSARDFWELLINGREAIIPLPESRWLPECIPAACRTRKVEAGFLTAPVDEFDSKFFGISGKEAEYIDPQHRLLHEVAWEALEDAMLDPHTLRGTRTGIFVGSWLQNYMDIANQSVDEDFFRNFMGTSIGSGAARLAHFFQTVGPSIATESGCSSAMVAMDMACKSLRNRDSNLALACGVNLLLAPYDVNTLSFVFSPEGRCKTFDESADGFGRAEGCAVLLMKRLSDATRDGDNIWGLVRGSAVTQEGTSTSFGTPTVHCESMAMELALKDAHVDPLDVSYIEAHGTGTVVGDPLEIAAITTAYSKGRSEPLVIGSVKTNVGHTESVSGLTGIIKVLLSMRNGMIPPHLNLKKLNPAINLDVIPAKIPLEAMSWEMINDKPRMAGVSSFGINGTDGHAIIQEPPSLSHPQLICNEVTPRPLHVMKISARSHESFDELLRIYENMFSSNEEIMSDLKFEDIAYSANTGRATFNHRALIIAKDFKEAANVIKSKSFKSAEVQSTGGKLCFLFTGQGSQYPNMGAELYKSSPIFRDAFNTCDQLLVKRYGIHLPEVLWGQPNDASELNRTIYSQTSIFCIEYCLFKLWASWGVKPDFVMGHSLGEFAAAVAAGILNFEDALMLVAERSGLIDNLPRGKMLVIQANKDMVHQTIQKYKLLNPNFWMDYAALNSSDQTVVAGDSEMIEEFSQYCGSKSLKTTVLAATHAFHSRHMDPMMEAYRKTASTLKKVEVGASHPKYISGMVGKIIPLESINTDYWVRHTREPVKFIESCKAIHAEGCSTFLEIGPHPVLSALVMGNLDGQHITCLSSLRRKTEDWRTLLDSLAKIYVSDWNGQVNWKGLDRYYKRTRTPLPFYPFNRKPAWKRLEASFPHMHPLLGKGTPTGCDHTIFENRITLRNTEFVKDHVIGNTVVFPGAAFMEMCLAGGHATVQGSFNGELMKPRRPVALQSLRIISPLGLFDDVIYRLQTTSNLDMEEDGDIRYNVGIDRYVALGSSGTGEWISQATAKFLPVPPSPPKNKVVTPAIDIQSIQNTWESTDLTPFYNRLPEVGLRFGPKFQSLEMGWKSEAGILLSVKPPEDNQDKYLIHPIVADAMIQATMLWAGRDMLDKIKLQVPVQIGEFMWLEGSASATRFIYCENNEEGRIHSILLDEQGTPLARMSGVDFVETTVKLMEGMIQKQGTTLTKLWREVWKHSPGALQDSYNFRVGDEEPFLESSEEQKQLLQKHNDPGENEKAFYMDLCHLSRMYFLNAMYELGWRPLQGASFSPEELYQLLPTPKDHFKKYIRFFLQSLLDTGMLMADKEGDRFHFEGSPPSQEELDRDLKKKISSEDSSRVDYQMVTKTGRNLSEVWRGNVEPLQILFPEDASKASASRFYDAESAWLVQPILHCSATLFEEVIDQHYNTYMSLHGSTQPVLRILEVGAGTGVFSEMFLQRLERWGRPFEFYYTDISAAFFSGAEIRLEKYLKQIVFKRLDMEEDPLSQGLCPKYFDIILACEALHVAKDVRKTLGNITGLLKPGGIMQIIETTVQDPRETQIFGMLEGYWAFQDLQFRPYHPTLTPAKWEEALRGVNFDKVVTTEWYNSCHSIITARLSSKDSIDVFPSTLMEDGHTSWLIFYPDPYSGLMELLTEKVEGAKRTVRSVKRPDICTEEGMRELVKYEFQHAKEGGCSLEGVLYLWGLSDDIGNRDQSQISLPIVSLVQEICKDLSSPPRLYVVTQGTANVDGWEVSNPTAGTLLGMLKSFSNEIPEIQLNYLDLPPDGSVVDHAEEIFYDLWNVTKDSPNIAFRDGERLLPKMTSVSERNNDPLQLPSGCDRFQLVLPSTKMISDLEFGFLDKYALGETEVEVKVKAMALNFRDVFAVLKPTAQFEEINSVGLDYAGVITKVGIKVSTLNVGDRVIGMNMDKDLSLPSHIKTDEEHVVPLPASLTFEEGVTLPAVFFTAILCLDLVAKMKRGETVLIHTASGGVGLAALQLAKLMGVEVIATAGSKRKQNYLRNLGIKHVFHSRTTDFGKQILEVTNGRGVDIILNSITGEGFKEASLSALAKNGRFIEMSKLNVWTPEEVAELRSDVFYQIVDLISLEKPEMLKLIDQLKEYLSTDRIHPIPYERFDAVNIRGALVYLQKAKHIGKIVCAMPEAKVENSKITATTHLFNEMSTYLVTGGLGGIGFEVVKWILNSGAKHVAIASRSSPKLEVVAMIESWNKAGKHVEAFTVDIGDYGQCQELFDHLKTPASGFPQLRGVMHAAGVLADAILENQNWSKFEQTYNPKVNGSWNIHDLTKHLQLEHFVLFSSMAASFGSPGQSNHSASNCFEDSLAAYRRSNGLPATSINWGNWGEVGVATEIDFPGIRPISTSQGLLTLETTLKTQESHLCACNIDSFGLAVKLFPSLKSYVDDKRLFGDMKADFIINSDEFWKEVDEEEDREGKLLAFKNLIKSNLRVILKMSQGEIIDDLTDFQSLGVDSLMMLEMKNGLQNILGSRMTLTANELKDCTNTESLANRLVGNLLGEWAHVRTILPTMEKLQELLEEDSLLPEHIRPSQGMEAVPVSGVETVLLTGATGSLGPYILRELSNRPTIKKIICLVRKFGKVSPVERLIQRLKVVHLEDQVDMSKVECIRGDVTHDKFGLLESEYSRLAGSVDTVFNSAVRADHTAKYYKAPESMKQDLRTVNVKGTLRILEFAVHTKLKHVYQGSSLLSVFTTEEDDPKEDDDCYDMENESGFISEKWQEEDILDHLPYNLGYPLSKHISENLCRQAVERGIPCKTFRFPVVGGDSRDGRCDFRSNHIILRWLTFLKLRCVPDVLTPIMIIPVDHCVQLSLDVFFNPEALPDIYNVIHVRHGAEDKIFVRIGEELGIPMEILTMHQFIDRLKLEGDDSPLAPFMKLYRDDEEEFFELLEENSIISSLKRIAEESKQFFKSRKLEQLMGNYWERYEPSEVVIRRDLSFLKECGAFEKFGIK